VTHDIIVIGASAGGVEALRELTRGFRFDLPAAVFVVIHFPATQVSYLPQILSRETGLRVAHAVDGARIERGHIYVAPPNHHLVLHPGHMTLTKGAHENGMRPAIDPLFRTAAATYDKRVVGLLLSGCLDDGTQGMRKVREHGGVTAVQDPQESLFAEMALSAMEVTPIEHVLPVRDLAPLLTRLAREKIPGGEDMPRKREIDVSEMDEEQLRRRAIDGRLTDLTCPHCSGSLWESDNEKLSRFECRVGHAYSPKSLNEEQLRTLESRAWTLLRSIEERRDLSSRLTEQAAGRGLPRAAAHYRRQAALNAERAIALLALIADSRQEAESGAQEKEALREEIRLFEERSQDGLRQ